jgi:hypothetical protein
VTEHDVASFYSYLETRPTAQQLDAFRRSPRCRAVVEHLRAEGATDADVAAMLAPGADDPLLVSLPFSAQRTAKKSRPQGVPKGREEIKG